MFTVCAVPSHARKLKRELIYMMDAKHSSYLPRELNGVRYMHLLRDGFDWACTPQNLKIPAEAYLLGAHLVPRLVLHVHSADHPADWRVTCQCGR